MPTFLHVCIANSISFWVATPVDNIIGFPLEATYSISWISFISNDAKIADKVYIGPKVVIEKNVIIEKNVGS